MADPKMAFAGGKEGEDLPDIAVVDFDSSDSPIYLQLTTIFRRQIAFGSWDVGERIPTIETLAAQYGVSHGTVRQALAFLEREGLIQRKRRRGTTVVRRPTLPAPIALPQKSAEIAKLLSGLSAKIISEEQSSVSDRKIRRTERAYRRGDKTVILEIERGTTGIVAAGKPGLSQLKQLIDKNYSVRQITTIGTADTEAAQKLNIPVNAPVVMIKHIVEDDGKRIALETDWLMRGDLFTMLEHYPGPQGGAE